MKFGASLYFILIGLFTGVDLHADCIRLYNRESKWKIFHKSTYIGCRIYNRTREMSFEADTISEVKCLEKCVEYEALLMEPLWKNRVFSTLAPASYCIETRASQERRKLHLNEAVVSLKQGSRSNLDHIGEQASRKDLYRVPVRRGQFPRYMRVGNTVQRPLKISPDEKFIQTISARGETRYFQVAVRQKDAVFLEDRQLNQTPFSADPELPYSLPTPHKFKWTADELPLLTRHLASLQAAASLSSTQSQLYDLSRLQLAKIRNKKPLTLADLEAWNRVILNDGPTSGVDFFTHSVVRGTYRVERESFIYREMDLTDAGVWGKLLVDDDKFIPMVYFPAREVPSRTVELLNRVNQLGLRSSLRELSQIYQDFVVIHPFSDGNGRTARALVEYGLMKMGFSPLLRSKTAPRLTLFTSVQQLEKEIAETFLR